MSLPPVHSPSLFNFELAVSSFKHKPKRTKSLLGRKEIDFANRTARQSISHE